MHRPYALVAKSLCGFERDSNFSRVMTVIIDNSNSDDLAVLLKAALRAVKIGKSYANVLCRCALVYRSRRSRNCVENIVFTRNVNGYLTELFALVHKVESRFESAYVTDIFGVVIAA